MDHVVDSLQRISSLWPGHSSCSWQSERFHGMGLSSGQLAWDQSYASGCKVAQVMVVLENK